MAAGAAKPLTRRSHRRDDGPLDRVDGCRRRERRSGVRSRRAACRDRSPSSSVPRRGHLRDARAGQNIGGVGPVGAAGAMAEVLVATDRTAFCLVTPDGTEDVVEIEPQRQVTEPEATTIAGSLAVYVDLTVPVSWAGEATTITDDTGRLLFAVTMPGSADILVIDTEVPLGAPIKSPRPARVGRVGRWSANSAASPSTCRPPARPSSGWRWPWDVCARTA